MKLPENLIVDSMQGVKIAFAILLGSLSYGVWIFSNIGNQYSSIGMIAAPVGTAISLIALGLLNRGSFLLTSQTLATTPLFVGLVASLINLKDNHENEANIIIGFIFLTIILAGIIQFLFGFLKLGRVSEFIPYPIIVGIMNAVGLILIVNKLPVVLGFQHNDSYLDILKHPGKVQILTTLVGLITLFFLFTDKIFKKIPSSIIGFVGGSLVYYFLKSFFHDLPIGPVVGNISSDTSFLYGINALRSIPEQALQLNNFYSLITICIFSAISIAFVGSIETLLTSLVAGTALKVPQDSNRVLLSVGVGNIVSGFLGGLFSGGISVVTLSAIKDGARTSLTLVISGFLILIFLFVGWPLIAQIPNVVIDAFLFSIGLRIIDIKYWINLFKNMLDGAREQFNSDVGITLLVIISSVLFNLMIALGVGIALAIIFFLRQISKSCIRSYHTIDQIQSRVRRSEEEHELLLSMGKRCVVFQLQGSLFFASASFISEKIQAVFPQIDYVILDMKHVTYCDMTAINVLQQIYEVAKSKQKHLIFSSLSKSMQQYMQASGLYSTLSNSIFKTMDEAQEWVENKLLLPLEIKKIDYDEILKNSGLLNSLSEEEQAVIKEKLVIIPFKKNASLFESNGNKGSLFILLEGSTSVYSPDKDKMRLIGLSPGSIFGEIAFLTGKERSAEVIATTDCVVAALSKSNFALIKQNQSSLALKITINLAENLSNYLRHTIKVLDPL